MSETHTPGPWWLAPHANDGGNIRAAIGSVASVHFRESNAEHEANIRLIVAAPDLLAELRYIANANPREWHEETRSDFQAWAQNRARAAIAKAEGR